MKKLKVVVNPGDVKDLPLIATQLAHKYGGIWKVRNIVYAVVEDPRDNLSDLVYSGLCDLSRDGYPSADFSVVLGAARKSTEDATDEITAAIERFNAEVPRTSIKEIGFVVYDTALVPQ